MGQAQCERPSKVLPCTLNAIGTCKVFSNSVTMLLESTLFNYFRLMGIVDYYLKICFDSYTNIVYFVFDL